jgi:hypothetical protein
MKSDAIAPFNPHSGGNMRNRLTLQAGLTLFLLAGCTGQEATTPDLSPQKLSLQAGPWGPESPPFNDEIILRGDGFGLVKFRQPNDGDRIVYLDTWVRDLAPNTAYLLQRAVDTNVNDDCTSTTWLTLGKGTTAQTITTDSRGTGREALYRNLGTTTVGTTFDIHFQVINASTSAVVLESECYQFTVTQ